MHPQLHPYHPHLDPYQQFNSLSTAQPLPASWADTVNRQRNPPTSLHHTAPSSHMPRALSPESDHYLSQERRTQKCTPLCHAGRHRDGMGWRTHTQRQAGCRAGSVADPSPSLTGPSFKAWCLLPSTNIQFPEHVRLVTLRVACTAMRRTAME